LPYRKRRYEFMSQMYVVVVKESSAEVDNPSNWMSREDAMSFPGGLRAEIDPSRKYRVAVWRAVARKSRHYQNRDKMLGIAAMLGISVASWAGLAVLISHFVR